MELLLKVSAIVFSLLTIALVVYFVTSLIRDDQERIASHRRLEADILDSQE